jgi:hypothetical protein
MARERILVQFCAVPAALRAACVALLVGVSGCGGGSSNGSAVPSSTSTPSPTPSPADPSQAPLVVGAALSIDDGASGNPIDLRVVRSANGDGFAVWLADDGTRRNLWANRYRAASSMWGTPINIEARDGNIDRFDVTVDASGNATVAWTERSGGSAAGVIATRFETSVGAWTTPILLGNTDDDVHITSDATGAVLAMYGVFGRHFDPVSGTWQPEDGISPGIVSSGHFFGSVALLDGSGNALGVMHYTHFFDSLVSGYFSRTTGWEQLPPDFEDGIYRWVPGSFDFGFIDNIQLANIPGGNFLAAWEIKLDRGGGSLDTPEIRVARFTTSTNTWTTAQTLVPVNAQNDVRFYRLGSDASGNALMLWTESHGTRTALKALRLDANGLACDAVRVIDRAVGGGAGRADLGVDPQGNAIAIWQQFEGGRPDDGSRSNIAINRFDRATGTWANAVFAETQPGNAISPSASAGGGQALLGWIQSEGGVNRVKALLQPLTNMPSQ